MRRTPRCIAVTGDGQRCTKSAGKRSGDLFLCGPHSTMWRMLLLDDGCRPETRRRLAYARWKTACEGQALILNWKRAAA